jgi:hypothetical protein
LKGHLKCKGQNNEDKGYFKPTGDAKEPFQKEKPKQNQTLFFFKKKMKTFLSFSYCCRNSPMMAGLVVARMQQQRLFQDY